MHASNLENCQAMEKHKITNINRKVPAVPVALRGMLRAISGQTPTVLSMDTIDLCFTATFQVICSHSFSIYNLHRPIVVDEAASFFMTTDFAYEKFCFRDPFLFAEHNFLTDGQIKEINVSACSIGILCLKEAENATPRRRNLARSRR
ncbi:hypothetical protein RND71_034061 [Anisodus tanguticus]|uniref:Uncharacterized protein n=1 Tax=Anisodus tanguticus TaxID=243964 RepID=A0AAE1UY17_9SOLA|nr:hypothetical protein RND71_034061 [Anisodus tanguticus]